MKITYNKDKNRYELDGEGTLLLTKSDYGINFIKLETVPEDQAKLDFYNWVVIKSKTKGVFRKFWLLYQCGKYIFKK